MATDRREARSAATDHAETVRRIVSELSWMKCYATDRERAFAAVDALEAENMRLRDALAGIANADTKYPSMPSGFTGDWEVLRDEAREVLTEDELGVWE